MPADRPRTAAQARAVATAADDDDGLAAAWEAERPCEPDWRKLPGGAESGQACPKCGGPVRWTGAHTALICPACRVWDVSAGARARAAEHLAAIDKTAARKSAQLADPAAERAAAEQLAADRAELLDDLDEAAEILDVSDFPRHEPYAAARRAGTRYGAVVEHYRDRARHADTLDQLDRVRDEAWQFLQSVEAWARRIDELRDTLDDDDEPRGQVIRGEVEYDDDGQAARPRGGQVAELAHQAGVMPGQRTGALALMRAAHIPEPIADRVAGAQYGPWCSRCRTEQRRGADGRHFPAVARAEYPQQPFEDLCADHLAEAQRQAAAAGRTLHVTERYDSPAYRQWAAYDAAARQQAMAAGVRELRAAADGQRPTEARR